MSNFNRDSLPEISLLIQNNNPFERAGIVREQNIWGTQFLDVTTLNADVSDQVFEAINTVKNSPSEKITSLALTAQAGQGKTHLISRIRHHLVQEGGNSFVYVNVGKFKNLDLVFTSLQETLADSLQKKGQQDVTQWQEIATAMFNQVYQQGKPERAGINPPELVSRFDGVYAQEHKKGNNLIITLGKRIASVLPDVDPYLIRAIFWTLSIRYSSYAVRWLTGDELEPREAKALGLPSNSGKTEQQRENDALKNLREILNIVSVYHSLVICFDEIDSEQDKINQEGLNAPQVIATVIKRLYDTLTVKGKGIVLLTVMLPDTWRNTILAGMGGGTPDRLSTYTQKKPLELQPLNGQSMLELVTRWLGNFYQQHQQVPPHSLYPFNEQQLRDYAQQNKPSVREALKWCAKNFKLSEDELPADPQERFNLALSRIKVENGEDLLKDNEAIAEILKFGFLTLQGQRLEGETTSGEKLQGLIIEEITEIEPKDKNKGFINFKVVGKEQDKTFKLGVAVIQQTHGSSVGVGMERLIDFSTFDIDRGCLVRSKTLPFKKNWKAYGYAQQLEQQGGEWVDLKAEEINPLVELYQLNQNRERYQLSQEQVYQFAQAITITNPLLLEILSDPSEHWVGEIEEDSIDLIIPDSLEADPLDQELESLFSEWGQPESETPESNPENQEMVGEEEDGDEVESSASKQSYKGQSIQSFTFDGSRYEVDQWVEFLVSICDLLRMKHKKEFVEKVTPLKSKTGIPYFTTDPKDLKDRYRHKISGTKLYVYTSLQTNQIYKRVQELIAVFGYPESSLTIELK